LSSLEGTTDDNAGNKPLNAWFLGGVFSSPEAFQSFDKLFTPSTHPRSIQCHKKERVDADDDEKDQFVNCFPLLQETIGEPWTLNDFSFLNLNGLYGSEERYWLPQSSRPEFVVVGFLCVFFTQPDTQNMMNSTCVILCIRPSLKLIWIGRPLYFRLVQPHQKQNFNSC